ncbi:MAG: type IV secretion protein Rhs, partial [Clostridia bacterium]|nr:type IV secretion protein Rhs [Clostridia bacterium]
MSSMVWAEDPETGERALKRVVRTFLNEKDELVHVQVNGETITCTTEHPFYVQGKGWLAAKDLKLNDKLELQNGEDAFVDAIRR